MIMNNEINKEIYKKDYIAGAYLRKCTKGYFQFLRYNYGSIKVDKAKNNEVFIDYFIDKLYSENIISKENHNRYYKALKDYFINFNKLKNKTDEEIYGEIYEIRKSIFGRTLCDFIDDKCKRELCLIGKKNNKHEFEQSLIDLIYCDIDEKNRIYTRSINQIEYFKTEILNKSGKLIFIPDNYKQLYYLLQFIVNILLPKWFKGKTMNELIKNNFFDVEIVIFLKERRIYDEAVVSDFEFIKEEKLIDNLEYYLNNDVIKVRVYNNKAVGLDLRKLEWANKEIFKKAVKGYYSVIGLGEKSIFSLKNSNFDYFILSVVNRIAVQRYTNLYKNGSDNTAFLIGYMIKEFSMNVDFSGNERVDMSLYHYNYILNKFGINEETRKLLRDNKNNMVSLIPELYFNFYSNTYSSKGFPEFKLKINDTVDITTVMREKEKIFNIFLNEKMSKIFKGKYINSYYDMESNKKIQEDMSLIKDHNKLYVTGLIFNDISNIKLNPIEAENYNQSLISPREFIRKNNLSDEIYFYCNFLYFVTGNITETYNAVRNDCPEETIKVKDFFLGYKYVHTKENGIKELFPLYNKGFVGVTKSNKMLFGRRQLLGGSLKINNINLTWNREDVNELNSNKDICIYTPFIENKKLSNYHENFRNFSYKIGKNRINIVVINNKIECIRFGEITIPSIGVVISVKGQLISKIIYELGLQQGKNKYYNITKDYKIDVKLHKPDNISDDIWNELKWAFGGGTILVEDGKNLVSNHKKQIDNFKKEGWFHPLSNQTQETQVQEWVRGPRTVIGLTGENKFFIATFSGRTKESTGANFNEIVHILNKEIGNIQWAMNLDGGASVCLGMIYKREFFELNYPCVSNLSSAGMVRPVNSMMFITKG